MAQQPPPLIPTEPKSEAPTYGLTELWDIDMDNTNHELKETLIYKTAFGSDMWFSIAMTKTKTKTMTMTISP
jgi:hypothetical protein